MKCPFCNHLESKVVDSRLGKEKDSIRRRRECLGCHKRFTTSERAEDALPLVVKKDGRREPFDRLKIFSGLKKACEKRPISINELEKGFKYRAKPQRHNATALYSSSNKNSVFHYVTNYRGSSTLNPQKKMYHNFHI
jgi:transcriptional regulator NrdR